MYWDFECLSIQDGWDSGEGKMDGGEWFVARIKIVWFQEEVGGGGGMSELRAREGGGGQEEISREREREKLGVRIRGNK